MFTLFGFLVVCVSCSSSPTRTGDDSSVVTDGAVNQQGDGGAVIDQSSDQATDKTLPIPEGDGSLNDSVGTGTPDANVGTGPLSVGNYPILFVTQLPVVDGFMDIGSTFGNHLTSVTKAGRGGDLYIRYPDGELRNLTQEAGYGSKDEFQGSKSISVRDPMVHWDGKKAIFSMVIGGADKRYEQTISYWQLYEVTGLGKGEKAVITKVANQPTDYNHIYPIYGSDDRVIFVSDRPRSGERHLYPQLDEYEMSRSNTGIWSLDPKSGNLFLIEHSPSGSFRPRLDSFGRVIFTRWDHLQRDQQSDAEGGPATNYGTFNYSDESATAQKLNTQEEVFPEPRGDRTDLLEGTNLNGHEFNLFFPWAINQDGTEEETLNHIGRHELYDYINRAINDDKHVKEFRIAEYKQRVNQFNILNFFWLTEDPLKPGLYYGVDAPEFYTNTGGMLFKLQAEPTRSADNIALTPVTHPSTSSSNSKAENTGKYREPLPLSDGTLLAVHTDNTEDDHSVNDLDGNNRSSYFYRLKTLKQSGNYWIPNKSITSGIVRKIWYWDPDKKRSFHGEMWELNPVEVRPRTRPAASKSFLETPEQTVFQQVGVNEQTFRQYLAKQNLALVVSRNVTTRDQLDRQQPFNLKIANSATQTTGSTGKVYEISYLQFFQADQIRGLGGTKNPDEGRRVLAQMMHDPAAMAENGATSGLKGSVALGADGSMAAFVPARRAMTWQLTDSDGESVVRERYWVTFQPGEIRVCASCHGISSKDQAGNGKPQNPPQALKQLLESWKSRN